MGQVDDAVEICTATGAGAGASRTLRCMMIGQDLLLYVGMEVKTMYE